MVDLYKQGLATLVRDPELFAIPVLAIAFYAAEIVTYVVIVTRYWELAPFLVILGTPLALLLIGYGVTVLLRAAEVYTAYQRREGNNPTLGGSLAAAWRARKPLAAWACGLSQSELVFKWLAPRLTRSPAQAEEIGRMLEKRFWERVGFLVLPILTIERAPVADAVHQALGYLERYDREIRHSMLANDVLGVLVILATLGALFPWLLSLSAGNLPGKVGMTPFAASYVALALTFFTMFYLLGLVGILHRVHQGILYHRAVNPGPHSGPSQPG